jgi:hypothetical protein
MTLSATALPILRQVLKKCVAQAISTAPHVLSLTSDLTNVLPLPKELNTDRPLLFTEQTRALVVELLDWEKCLQPGRNPPPSKEGVFILAGPSGIGKSNIAYLVALRLFAHGTPLLYVEDAGWLVAPFIKDGMLDPDASLGILHALFQSFVMLNTDLLTPEVIARQRQLLVVPNGWKAFMQWLNELNAVVIIDEHGHAFNQLVLHGCAAIFPLLLPLSYDLGHRGIRAVFAGSNQAQFETQLNGSFSPCLRFVTPFTLEEAKLFLGIHTMLHAHELAAHERFANLVPREMMKLGESSSADAYVQVRMEGMRTLLTPLRNHPDLHLLVGMLDGLFRSASMGAGTTHVSFLDLGFVYRRKMDDSVVIASPLCAPATRALLLLWHDVSSTAKDRLIDAKGDGNRFENLVWDVLLSRGFSSSGLQLPCYKLGKDRIDAPWHCVVSEFVVSHGKPKEIELEIQKLQERARKLKINILFRCPDLAKTLDFCVISFESDPIAIQASISSLTEHDKPDPELLGRLKIALFIFVTTSPEDHARIGRGGGGDWWVRIGLEKLRIVNATKWIGI